MDFNELQNGRIPFIGVEFDGSNAVQKNPNEYQALIIGQKLSTASAVANKVVKVASEADAVAKFGAGSMLHRMFSVWFKNNSSTPVYAGVLSDAEAATNGTKTLTFTGPATEDGVLPLYVAGTRAYVSITSGMTAVQIATATKAKLDTFTTLPFTYAIGTNPNDHVITFTAKNKGVVGNSLDIRVVYYDSETIPAGVTAIVATGVTGATNPSLTTLISEIGPMKFEVVVCPYTDSTSVDDITEEMELRLNANIAKEGELFLGIAGTSGDAATFGASSNSKTAVAIAAELPVSEPCLWATALAANAAKYFSLQPSRPLTTLVLKGIQPPVLASRYTDTERETLLHDGISTYIVDSNGDAQIERVITMYKEDSNGDEDVAFLDATTMFTLFYLRSSLRYMLANDFKRYMLADDGNNVQYPETLPVATPSLIKSHIIALADSWISNAIIEDAGGFADGLIVERDEDDVNTVNVFMTPNLVNSLLRVKARVAFIL